MTERDKHNVRWAIISILVGFGTMTFMAWLTGADIFHPVRGPDLTLWFVLSGVLSFVIALCNWKIF